MHIVGFSLGAVALAAMACGIAVAAGWSVLASIGLGAASFGLAQLLYLARIAWMARAEARRRTRGETGGDKAPAEPRQSVVQKG